jgi:hypothetical protein
METGYTGLKSPPCCFSPSLQPGDDFCLEFRVVPFGVAIPLTDEESRFTRGSAGRLNRPHVKWITDDIARCGLDRHIDESLRVAGQQRSERGVGSDSRRAELTDRV